MHTWKYPLVLIFYLSMLEAHGQMLLRRETHGPRSGAQHGTCHTVRARSRPDGSVHMMMMHSPYSKCQAKPCWGVGIGP